MLPMKIPQPYFAILKVGLAAYPDKLWIIPALDKYHGSQQISNPYLSCIDNYPQLVADLHQLL